MSIMNKGRPIDTYAEIDIVLFYESAPFIIEQDSICLNRMGDLLLRNIHTVNRGKRFFIETDWQHEWLTRMPNDAKPLTDHIVDKHVLDGLREN